MAVDDIRDKIGIPEQQPPAEPSPDPLIVAESMLDQAQRSINAARMILKQQRALTAMQGSPSTEGTCPHPPQFIRDKSTMGETIKFCDNCKEIVYSEVNEEPT